MNVENSTIPEIINEATPSKQFIHSYSRKGNPWENACGLESPYNFEMSNYA